MVRWTCPYCGKSMHSACGRRDEKVVVCLYCEGTFENPFFRKEGERMRILAQFTGTVKQFRAWLAKQNRQAQIIDLAEYRGKRKTAPRRTKEKLSTQV